MTSSPVAATVGSLRVTDGTGIVHIEQRYDADAAVLWSALTDPAKLAAWYGPVTGDLSQGGRFRVRVEGPDIDATGLVLECTPSSVLRVQTRETDESAHRGNGQPFDMTIEVTLVPDDGQTSLVMEIRGLPLEKLAAYGVGWQLHAEALGSVVTGQDRPDVGMRWAELNPHYQSLASQLS
jgi:uncharacterized protein YndB with AHSA1/START domain